jgi:hypothetical protein
MLLVFIKVFISINQSFRKFYSATQLSKLFYHLIDVTYQTDFFTKKIKTIL